MSISPIDQKFDGALTEMEFSTSLSAPLFVNIVNGKKKTTVDIGNRYEFDCVFNILRVNQFES